MSSVLDDRKADRRKAPTDRAHAAVRPRRGAAADRVGRSKAAQRALDRRERRSAASMPVAAGQLARRRVGGVPLVIPVLTLIVGALALTLYLSTKSAQDSYAIDALREQNNALQAKRDDLKRTFDKGDSAPELAAKAAKQGMVPGIAGAQIVVGPDGTSRIVGSSRPASGDPLPPLNPKQDPVRKIDSSKVDDSQGLGGDTPSTPTTPTTPTTPSAPTVPSQNPVPQQPAGQRPTTNVRPDPRQRRQTPSVPSNRVNAPATNVIPPNSATPRPNTATAR